MAGKKDFKKNTAELFISAADQPQEAETGAVSVPAGYKLVKESKSARLQLLIRPTTKEYLKKLAKEQGTSLNDLINNVLDEYAERNGKA